MTAPSPRVLAEFDQAHAETLTYLANLRAAYIHELSHRGRPRYVNLASLAAALADGLDRQCLGQLVAVLLDREVGE